RRPALPQPGTPAQRRSALSPRDDRAGHLDLRVHEHLPAQSRRRRMGRAGAVTIAVVAALGSISAARAEACPDHLDDGPLLAGPGSADFGQVPEACASTDLFLRQRGELLADKADFYGVLTAEATFRG